MPPAIPKRILLAYGALAMPLCVAEIPILLYLPAFYTQEVGLSAGLVGLVFLFARIWDGTCNVLVGWLSDRVSSRWGRRKPWVIIGAPLLIGATWFLCNPSPSAGLLYLAVCAALFYTADTIVKIPYLSWGAELAVDYVERSRVTAFRGTFTMLGALVFVSAPLVFLANNAPLREVLFLISIIVLVIIPLTVIQIGWFVRDPPAMSRPQISLLAGVASLMTNRVLRRFALAMLCYFLADGVINSLVVFSFSVGLQLPDKLFWVIFILYTSTICAVPLIMRSAQHAEKHRLLAGGMTVLAMAYCCHLVVPAGNFPMVATLWILAGFGNAAVIVLPTSMLADMIDQGEVAARERRPGAYTAIYSLIMKIGLAAGVGLSFGLLDLVGYLPGAEHHSTADVLNIRLLAFGLPCLLLAPAIILIWRHSLTRKVQQELRARIDARMFPM
jgi:glycoside/pentoside/hexuronide:cation symporter, GPH family